MTHWLSDPTTGPQIQFEAMLKVLFADSGTKVGVLEAIETIREWTDQTRENGEVISADNVDGEPAAARRRH